MNPTYDELLAALRSLVVAVGLCGHDRITRDERLRSALVTAADLVLRCDKAAASEVTQ